jgi:hypothetical protein
MKKILYIFLISFLFASYADAKTGTISSTSHTASVCHDVSCTTPTPGIINFAPTTGSPVVVDTVTGLTGKIWGNELGWIDLHPTGEGVTFANISNGLLTGKAWSQVSGWINFKPTGQQVLIDMTTGELSGYAWTGGPEGGWIKFDCSSSNSCVKVSWASTTSGGGGGGGYSDVCPNITGVQATIPSGYTVSIDGLCVEVIDVCPNIPGDQSAIPPGFNKNAMGSCIPDIDYCPNINGSQNVTPSGYIVDTKGNCIKPKKDMCPDLPGIQDRLSDCNSPDLCTNLAGVQSNIPKGYTGANNYCYPESLDLCKNIEGNQSIVPAGSFIDAKSNCVANLLDMCINLSGQQDHIPLGFYQDGNLCLFYDGEEKLSLVGVPIIGFSFIPEKVKVANNNPFLKNVVGSITHITGDFRVDLVSVGVGIVELILLILIFIWIARRLMR